MLLLRSRNNLKGFIKRFYLNRNMNKELFGLPQHKDTFEEYIGNWIIIHAHDGASIFSGKLIAMENGYGTLNPFSAGFYDLQKGYVRKIINQNFKVNLNNIMAIEPTTKKSLENCSAYLNRMAQNQRRK